MNSDILKQYRCLRKEFVIESNRITEMEKEIENMSIDEKEVSDVVSKGKKGKKTLGTCMIRGTEDYTTLNRKRAKLRERKAKQELRLAAIENTILDVEEFINSAADSETRMMLRLFYISEKQWDEVAEEMGEGYTAEACRKKVQRFLSKSK